MFSKVVSKLHDVGRGVLQPTTVNGLLIYPLIPLYLQSMETSMLRNCSILRFVHICQDVLHRYWAGLLLGGFFPMTCSNEESTVLINLCGPTLYDVRASWDTSSGAKSTTTHWRLGGPMVQLLGVVGPMGGGTNHRHTNSMQWRIHDFC